MSADDIRRLWASRRLAALLAQSLRLHSASDLHSRITLLEEATRACHAELQRRPTHCREAPPPQLAPASSSCMLLQLSRDEMGVVEHELCDPLRPLLAVNLSSTAKGMRVPMQAALAKLRQHFPEVEAFAANMGISIWQLQNVTGLKLGSEHGTPLNLTDWTTLSTLVSCGSLSELVELEIEGDGHHDQRDVLECEGVSLFAAGLRRGGLPSLHLLDLSATQIGDQAASALASALTKRALPVIRSLHLDMNQIGDDGLLALAPALRQLPTLEEFHMFACYEIRDPGLAALIAQPMEGVLESLQILNFSECNITDAGCAIFASALRSGALPALTAVDLREDHSDYSPAHAEINNILEARLHDSYEVQ